MPFKHVEVETVYGKQTELDREDVKTLMEWAGRQPHLPEVTELLAILFLQSCYYRLEPAKAALDNYFTIRTLCPDVFLTYPDDAALKTTMDITVLTPLPQRTADGQVVFYSKLMDFNPDYYIWNGQTKLFDMVAMLDLHQNGPNEGLQFIIDMTGGTFTHATKVNLIILKKYAHYLQDAMPVRLKGIHLINVVPFLDKVMAMVRPFIRKEVFDLLHVHANSLDTLYQYVPNECLPEELGGSAPSMKILQEKCNANIVENFDFFLEHQKLKVDERLRPGKPKDAGSIFGVDGTFKKLEFD